MIDAVVSHHLDGFRSGVARFNELLASNLGVPLLGIFNEAVAALERPLLSFKVGEFSPGELDTFEQLLDHRTWRGDVFLHDFRDLPLERRMIAEAPRVYCGNAAIAERVSGLAANVETLWAPGLLMDDRVFSSTEISVFSFGMAHKIHTEMFRRLRELLDASQRSWSVYVSAANHETASLRDAEIVFREMHEIFPEGLYFLGNLSDVAVVNQLRESTFFAAFFDGGVRANNTSVASALERGAVVITNLDQWSPPDYVHLENVIDINRCTELPSDPADLARISANAAAASRARSWEKLSERLRA